MLPILFAAAEASHDSGIAGQFGLEPKYVIMQVISFLILFGVLYWFGIKPTIATMEERNAKIASGLKHAEDMQAKLAEAQKTTEAQLREAQQKAQAIVADAQKAAKAFEEKQQKAATDKAAALLAKAQQAIELEHKKMLADARTEIARLVVTTTERVLAKKLTDADRAAYNDAASRELTNV
jgi:F-type H+-transporting ATPase subunit b